MLGGVKKTKAHHKLVVAFDLDETLFTMREGEHVFYNEIEDVVRYSYFDWTDAKFYLFYVRAMANLFVYLQDKVEILFITAGAYSKQGIVAILEAAYSQANPLFKRESLQYCRFFNRFDYYEQGISKGQKLRAEIGPDAYILLVDDLPHNLEHARAVDIDTVQSTPQNGAHYIEQVKIKIVTKIEEIRLEQIFEELSESTEWPEEEKEEQEQKQGFPLTWMKDRLERQGRESELEEQEQEQNFSIRTKMTGLSGCFR